MGPKRSNPIDNPPAASSSEEEEEEDEEATSSEQEQEVEEEEQEEGEGSSEEDEDEEDEEEQPKSQTAPLAQKSQPLKKPETATPATVAYDSDETGSDSESDSDSPTPNVKPLASKPMEETANAKRSRSRPLASPVKASTAKRPNESEQEAKEAKRPKKKAGDEGTAVDEVKKTGEDAKKQLFQRLFTEDDEIALLKGMLDYSSKKGADPVADMNAFYDFVKTLIHTDVTKAQLMDKVRRLRKKYENNAGKGKMGEDRTFSKPHEQKAFELSKLIWGKDGISGKENASAAKLNAGKSNGKAKKNNKPVIALKAELPSSPEKKVEHGEPMEVDKKSFESSGCLFDKSFGVGGLEEEILKNGFDIIGGEKKAALEEKWRKLQIAELELFLQRNELVREQAELMLAIYKSEDK